jgi:hypothetical protein
MTGDDDDHDDDRPPLDERLTTRKAMETGVPEGTIGFPDTLPEPVDLALDRLAELDAERLASTRPTLASVEADDDRPPPTSTPAPDALGQRFTVSEAARACRVDRRTLRRFLDRGDFPNARRKVGPHGPDSGPWTIPLADLVAAGLRVHQPAGPDLPTAPGPDLDALARLRADLDAERHRRELAEHGRELAERERDRLADNVADLRTALRMLGPGPQTPTPAPSTPPSTPPPTVERRPRWWRKAGP